MSSTGSYTEAIRIECVHMTSRGHVGGVNKETAALLEKWKILLWIELYLYANSSFCFIMQIRLLVTWANTLYWNYGELWNKSPPNLETLVIFKFQPFSILASRAVDGKGWIQCKCTLTNVFCAISPKQREWQAHGVPNRVTLPKTRKWAVHIYNCLTLKTQYLSALVTKALRGRHKNSACRQIFYRNKI